MCRKISKNKFSLKIKAFRLYKNQCIKLLVCNLTMLLKYSKYQRVQEMEIFQKVQADRHQLLQIHTLTSNFKMMKKWDWLFQTKDLLKKGVLNLINRLTQIREMKIISRMVQMSTNSIIVIYRICYQNC